MHDVADLAKRPTFYRSATRHLLIRINCFLNDMDEPARLMLFTCTRLETLASHGSYADFTMPLDANIGKLFHEELRGQHGAGQLMRCPASPRDPGFRAVRCRLRCADLPTSSHAPRPRTQPGSLIPLRPASVARVYGSPCSGGTDSCGRPLRKSRLHSR
ncbi:hypothetical protein DFH06DRAFT_1167249 [Mycena polygramma]|nr:hypothetical protein DFH06DRAFT_1167249 [Mycena polygramma]